MIDTYYLETVVLASMVNSKDCCNRAFEIDRTHFIYDNLMHVYDSIVEILEGNASVNIGELACKKCDISFLQECDRVAPTTENFDSNLQKLKALHHKRKVLQQIESLKVNIEGTDFDNTDDLMAMALDAIEIKAETKSSMDLKDIYAELFIDLENGANQKPMSYQIKELDELTQGVFNNELTVIAARPGMGKTAFAICVAVNLAKQGYKGLFVSREMGEVQLIRRIIAYVLGMNSQNLKKLENLSEKDLEKLVKHADLVTKLPLKIDTKKVTIEEIKALAKMLKRKNELDFIVIDYLQLLKTNKHFQSREQEVSYYSREIRLLSQELDIPIFLLAQLNRAVEQRTKENQVPLLSDLRESGSIEQDANNVYMLYQSEQMEKERLLDIVIRKQREGCLGTATVKYYKPTNLIVSRGL